MYKALVISVVLLAALAFMSGSRPADASPTIPISPVIVAKGSLPNQTAPIPTTTIFTPTQTGLYRLSVYAVVNRADINSNSFWCYSYQSADDAGPQQFGGQAYCGYGGQLLPFVYQDLNPGSGIAQPFEAVAGQPITYNVIQFPAPDDSAYSLYYTLERLQ